MDTVRRWINIVLLVIVLPHAEQFDTAPYHTFGDKEITIINAGDQPITNVHMSTVHYRGTIEAGESVTIRDLKGLWSYVKRGEYVRVQYKYGSKYYTCYIKW